MKIWIVVSVKRGLIEKPEVFLSHNEANKRFKELSKNINHYYDELEIFEKNI